MGEKSRENLEPEQPNQNVPHIEAGGERAPEVEQQPQAEMPDWLRRDIKQREAREKADAKTKIEQEFGGEISPELRKDLLGAAKLSNTPENLAMMTQELRAMLENVRKNRRIFFFGHGNSGEGPQNESEFQITANQRGLSHEKGLHWSVHEFVNFGKSKINGDFKYVVEGRSRDEEPPTVELLGISPTDEEDWALTYKYGSEKMTDIFGRRGCFMEVGLALPESEARELYAQMKTHPEYLREFIVCCARDTEGEFPKIILGERGETLRKVDWKKTDNQRKIKFMEFDGGKYGFHQMEPAGGKWREIALPEKLSQHQTIWNNDLEQRRQRAKMPPKKKPGMFKKFWNFITENYEE